MNVTLNIENDAELRAYIKDCIKGQVLSIVREEFVGIIQAELERKIKASGENAFDRMKKDAAAHAIRKILLEKHNVAMWNDEFITPIVTALVNQSLGNKNWDLVVDKFAKDRIMQLLNKKK